MLTDAPPAPIASASPLERPIRVMIIDDHRLVRQVIARALKASAEMELVAEVDCAEDGFERLDECAPDVVVMDLTMPGIGGLAALERVRRTHPEVRTLAISMHHDASHLRDAIRAGTSSRSPTWR